jgi:type I restriction-modification system DNA methylase subunit
MKIRRRQKNQIRRRRKTFPYTQTSITKTSYLDEVKKSLYNISHMGYNPLQVLNDWIELMFWTFQRNDEKYLAVMKKYKNDGNKGTREADYFAKALGMLLAHMKETNEEVLSYLYMDCNPNKNVGQFFTPHSVCQLMSAMVTPAQGNILDPACGAGVNLISLAKNMTCKQVDKSFFVGQDIDRTCVQMTALNLMFFNLPGAVILGNTLKMEVLEVYRTQRSYVWGGSIVQDFNIKRWKYIMESPFIKHLRKRRWL